MGKKMSEYDFVVKPPAPLAPPPVFVVKAVDKPRVIRCIETIEGLFGRNGANWIKGSYHNIEDGVDKFCLVGAAQKANGPYETAARLAIGLAANVRVSAKPLPLNENSAYDLKEGRIIKFNDAKKTTWRDVKAVLRQAKKIVQQAPTHV